MAKNNPAHAGMIECEIVDPRFGKPGTKTLMHPRDALEHHKLGQVKADPTFIESQRPPAESK